MPNTIMFPADFNTPVASALKDITKVQQRLFPQDQFFLSEYLLRGPISVPSGTVEDQVAKLDEGGYSIAVTFRMSSRTACSPVWTGTRRSPPTVVPTSTVRSSGSLTRLCAATG